MACSIGIAVLAPSSTESATANGDTRTLHLYHTHTGETIDATFRVDGHYDTSVLRQLNHFLRDWRNDDEINMDPRLFDAVWEAYRTAGATDRIQIYSAYRSPETNAMLRRRSRAVAEHSQHMLGKAMDTTMPGFPMERIREAGMRLQHGGVGWYPSANFVHLDVGGVRSWPRMSYDQLASLFPDGKTVHIAADGRTMPGYDQARVEIAERGGTEIPPAQQSQGFFAWLFGGGSNSGVAREDEEDRRAPTSAPVAVASAARPAAPQTQALAFASADSAQQGQPLANQAPLAAQNPAPDGQVQYAGQKVAALEPGDLDKKVVADVDLPMPPRRPVDLVSVPDIPLPPVRPTSFAALQSTPIRLSDAQTASLPSSGSLVTANGSGVPMIRKSRLPAIITKGLNGHGALPRNALAFGSVGEAAIPEPVARPASLGRSPTLRGNRQHTASITSQVVAEDEDTTVVVAGPKLVGLRKAARLAAEKAAL